jgi:hypothetical protein
VCGKDKQLIPLILFSCFPVTSQSATRYTAVYAAVGSFVATFVVTVLICGIILLAIQRYDIIVSIILSFSSIFFSERQILKQMIREDISTMKTMLTI